MKIIHDFKLKDKVSNPDVYYGREVFTVVGIRADEIEVGGDWSGGTHAVYQKDWCKAEGWVKNE